MLNIRILEDEVFVNEDRFVREDTVEPELRPTPLPKEKGGLGFNTNDSRYYQTVNQFTNVVQTPSFYSHGDAVWGDHGYPIKGKTFLPLKVRGGRKLKVGNYVISHSGSGKGPDSLKVEDGQESVLLKFEGEIAPDLTIHHEDDTDFYTDTFSSRAGLASCIRYLDPMWANIAKGYGDEPFVRRIVGNVDYSHILMTPEIISDISLKFNTAAWLCIPHLWDLALVRSIAKRFAEKLVGSNIRLYVENSNEVWNGFFPQGKFAKAQGYSGYHADRTADVVSIFKEEYPHVVGVLGSQLDSPALLDGYFRNGEKDLSVVDGVAVNPYMGGEWTRKNETSILSKSFAEIHKNVRADFEGRVKSKLDAWQDRADIYGLDLLAYEGGMHTEPKTNKYKKDEATMTKLHGYAMSEEAGALCGEMYDFFAERGSLNMAYMDVSSGAGLIFGNRECELDEDSPRWKEWISRATS